MSRLSRREVLVGGLAGAIGARVEPPAPTRPFRAAYLTDTHVQPERGAGEALRRCLERVYGLNPRPDLILTGGDSVMMSMAAPRERVDEQWRVWDRVWADFSAIPVEHCLGNHDIWGWDKAASGTTGSEALWGKAMGMERLKLETPYRTFTRGGWRFVILDSVQSDGGNSYVGELDPGQYEWLESVVAPDDRTPTLVLSHIPIHASTPLMLDGRDSAAGWSIPPNLMHRDGRRLVQLFSRRTQVKLCLSGHIHLLGTTLYNGVTYFSNGAVSGAWWRGPHQQTSFGFGVIDLSENGSVSAAYVDYEWKARD